MGIITDALDLLRRDGWCKGDLRNEDGAHCISGALFEVSPGGVCPVFLDAGDKIVRAIRSQFPRWTPMIRSQFPQWTRIIPLFNDDLRTSFSDVELVMEKAALEMGESL